MQTFYLLVEENRIFPFCKKGKEFINQYIDGNDHIEYDLRNFEDEIMKMVNILLDEFNLSSPEDIDFKIFVDDNRLYIETERLLRTLKAAKISSLEVIDLRKILFSVINKFSEIQMFMVKEYGINFDGKNYVVINNELLQKDFSLNGMTLSEKDLMKFLSENMLQFSSV